MLFVRTQVKAPCRARISQHRARPKGDERNLCAGRYVPSAITTTYLRELKGIDYSPCPRSVKRTRRAAWLSLKARVSASDGVSMMPNESSPRAMHQVDGHLINIDAEC